MGVKDSLDLAKQDWDGTAAFDRDEDEWGRRWAEAYLEFAAGEKRAWLHEKGVRFFPVVGWAERGGYNAIGHGNSVPRFHITWGTGPGVLAPFIARVKAGEAAGLVEFRHRHRVDELIVESGAVVGVRGAVLAAGCRGARRTLEPRGGRRLRAARRLGGRRFGRHRRQPRPRAAVLARAHG